VCLFVELGFFSLFVVAWSCSYFLCGVRACWVLSMGGEERGCAFFFCGVFSLFVWLFFVFCDRNGNSANPPLPPPPRPHPPPPVSVRTRPLFFFIFFFLCYVSFWCLLLSLGVVCSYPYSLGVFFLGCVSAPTRLLPPFLQCILRKFLVRPLFPLLYHYGFPTWMRLNRFFGISAFRICPFPLFPPPFLSQHPPSHVFNAGASRLTYCLRSIPYSGSSHVSYWSARDTNYCPIGPLAYFDSPNTPPPLPPPPPPPPSFAVSWSTKYGQFYLSRTFTSTPRNRTRHN